MDEFITPPVVMAMLGLVGMGIMALPEPPISRTRLVVGCVLAGAGALYYFGTIAYLIWKHGV